MVVLWLFSPAMQRPVLEGKPNYRALPELADHHGALHRDVPPPAK